MTTEAPSAESKAAFELEQAMIDVRRATDALGLKIMLPVSPYTKVYAGFVQMANQLREQPAEWLHPDGEETYIRNMVLLGKLLLTYKQYYRETRSAA